LLLRAFAEFHKKAFKVENGFASGSIERWIERLILYDAWKDCDIVGSSTRLIYSRLDVKLPTDKVLEPPAIQGPSDSRERTHRHPLNSVPLSYRLVQYAKSDTHGLFRVESGGYWGTFVDRSNSCRYDLEKRLILRLESRDATIQAIRSMCGEGKADPRMRLSRRGVMYQVVIRTIQRLFLGRWSGRPLSDRPRSEVDRGERGTGQGMARPF
jgi:hypothetical protein